PVSRPRPTLYAGGLGGPAYDVARDPELEGRKSQLLAAGPQVGHLGTDPLGRVPVHQVRVAGARDQLLCRLRLTAGVQRRARPRHGLRLEDRVLDRVELPRVAEPGLGPHPAHHREPLGGAGVARVVLVELDAVLARLVGPPRRDRKSTRLNSSHVAISYAVFCLKKKKKYKNISDLSL